MSIEKEDIPKCATKAVKSIIEKSLKYKEDYGHALKMVANIGLDYALFSNNEEVQNAALKESAMDQLQLFFKKGGNESAKKLYDLLPEEVSSLITNEDLEEIGISF